MGLSSIKGLAQNDKESLNTAQQACILYLTKGGILNNKAFTLFEIFIAAILVTVITLAFFASLVTSFNHLRRIVELRTASLVLQEQISMARGLEFSDILSIGGTFSSASMSSLKNATGSISQSFYGGHNEIIKLSFKLDWTDFNGEPTHKSLVTLMTDHGINKK